MWSSGKEKEMGGSTASPMQSDDVQDVYANFDIPEQVLESVAS